MDPRETAMRFKTRQWLKISFISGVIALFLLVVLIIVRCYTKTPCPNPELAGTKHDKTVKIALFDNFVSWVQASTGLHKK